MNPPVNYSAIAHQIQSRSPLAARFLRIHMRYRKVGVKQTKSRTVMDKLKANNIMVSSQTADSLLHVLSEFGLGTVGAKWGRLLIKWNQVICLKTLAGCFGSAGPEQSRPNLLAAPDSRPDTPEAGPVSPPRANPLQQGIPNPGNATSHPVNYVSLAEQIQSRSPRAAFFLRIHLKDRRTGVRITTARTVMDKLAARNREISRDDASRMLHFFAQMGLGRVGMKYSWTVIAWNQVVCLKTLARHLEAKREKAAPARPVESSSTAATGRQEDKVECRIPANSLAALKATGLADHFGIEMRPPGC